MQLSPKIRSRDLEEFFSSIGQIRDIRVITDNKTGKSKGIAYVELAEPESVPLAIALTGQNLLDYPIVVAPTQAERNRLAAANAAAAAAASAAANFPPGGANAPPDPKDLRGVPTKVYVGGLHPNITESMIQGIFEPFGRILNVELVKDKVTGISKLFGFVTFQHGDEAQKAIDQLNGFELAGKSLKVHHLSETAPLLLASGGPGAYSYDGDTVEELDKAGFNLGTTGRLQLMAKLAQGSGMELPSAAQQAIQASSGGHEQAGAAPSSVTSSCYLLSNVFNPSTEASKESSIRHYIISECEKRGGCVHVYIDKDSPTGNIYVKAPTIPVATATINALHGKIINSRTISAAYIPEQHYYKLFPDAANANTLL